MCVCVCVCVDMYDMGYTMLLLWGGEHCLSDHIKRSSVWETLASPNVVKVTPHPNRQTDRLA